MTTVINLRDGIKKPLINFGSLTQPMASKMLYFLNFVKESIIAPVGFITNETRVNGGHPVYWEVDTCAIDYIGLLFLALCLISFTLNYKDRFCKVCGGWILFSFFVVGIMGWGLVNIETFLYSLYFGWAYLALVFKLAERLLSKTHKYIKMGVYSAAIIALVTINIQEFINVVKFGIEYYPVT